jgi:hypothetical protein
MRRCRALVDEENVLLVILFSILFIAAASALPGKYLASRLRVPFHYPSCEWAQKIAPRTNMVPDQAAGNKRRTQSL